MWWWYYRCMTNQIEARIEELMDREDYLVNKMAVNISLAKDTVKHELPIIGHVKGIGKLLENQPLHREFDKVDALITDLWQINKETAS